MTLHCATSAQVSSHITKFVSASEISQCLVVWLLFKKCIVLCGLSYFEVSLKVVCH